MRVLAIIASCWLIGTLVTLALGETWRAVIVSAALGVLLGWAISRAE